MAHADFTRNYVKNNTINIPHALLGPSLQLVTDIMAKMFKRVVSL